MFVVIEGADKSGKTTLIRALKETPLPDELSHVPVTFMRYPNRDGPIGSIIHSYLTREVDLNEETAQLLFAADRMHTKDKLIKAITSGVVICDRYIYSGLAYASAKGVDIRWCSGLAVGLPTPDLIVYLSITEETQIIRGLGGEEKYETRAIQKRVREQYTSIMDYENAFGSSRVLQFDANQPTEIISKRVMSEIVRYTPNSTITPPFEGY